MKRLIILLCLSLLLSGCGASAPAPATASDPTAIPTEAPAEKPYDGFVFSTTDRDGNPWDESAFAGHALTMLNFWEPWCGPCVGEMPDLQRLQDAYADRGFQILGVYSTPGMESDVQTVLDKTGVTYPILHYTDVFDRFQSGYVPTTVFIDAEGLVIGEGDEALYIGSNSYDGWAAIIEGLL